MKGSPDVETMAADHARLLRPRRGWTLTRGHARSGDATAIATYLGK